MHAPSSHEVRETEVISERDYRISKYLRDRGVRRTTATDDSNSACTELRLRASLRFDNPIVKVNFVVFLHICQHGGMNKRKVDPETARVSATAGELRVLIGQFRRRLREEAHAGDFTPSQISVLSRLEREGPATVTTLAQAEGVRPQSMGATVSALQAAGFVIGSPHPTDGRQTVLSLTPACREWIKASRAAREDWLFRTIQAKLSLAEQKKLAGAVELLKRLVDA
jgi:DNA-binding MarR family transcriptional regulator